MNWLTFDIVKQGSRTHVYSVPQALFTSFGPANFSAMLTAKESFVGVLKGRHPDSDGHEGEPFGVDVGSDRMFKQRMLAQLGLSEADLEARKPVYDHGTPEHLEVLVITVESGIAGDLFGRQIRVPRPVFPDHPQYREVKKALRHPSTTEASASDAK